MTASKGPTLLIAQLRKAADRRASTDPRGCIFTNAADCLQAQAEKISRQRDEIAALRNRLQQNTTNEPPAVGSITELG